MVGGKMQGKGFLRESGQFIRKCAEAKEINQE